MHLKTSFNVENVIFYWTSSGCLRFLACHNNTMAAAALHWRGDWLGTWLIFFPRFPLSCLRMHTSSQRRVLSRQPRLVAACTHYRAPSWPPAVSGPVFSSWPDPLLPPPPQFGVTAEDGGCCCYDSCFTMTTGRRYQPQTGHLVVKFGENKWTSDFILSPQSILHP